MVQFRLAIVVIAACASAGTAFAQVAPPAAPLQPAAPQTAAPPVQPRFGVVNLQAVFTESNLGKQSLVQVTALRDKLRLQLEARATEIQGLSDRIKTQSGVASEATIVGWNIDLLRLQREAQFAQQEADIQVQHLQNALLDAFQTKVAPVVEALRAEKGLAAVFGVQGSETPGSLTLLAIDPGVNLSADVVARLNAQG